MWLILISTLAGAVLGLLGAAIVFVPKLVSIKQQYRYFADNVIYLFLRNIKKFHYMSFGEPLKAENIKDKLSKIEDIFLKQREIISQIESSKNIAVDSKYKVQLVEELISLEKKKFYIIKSLLLEDKVDITFCFATSEGEIKTTLSEYAKMVDIDLLNQDRPTRKSLVDKDGTPTKVYDKFMVYDGGKLEEQKSQEQQKEDSSKDTTQKE